MKTYNKETLVHWLFQRTTAIILFPIIILANPGTLIWFFLFAFWHLFLGLEEIIADYIHNEVTRNLILRLLRIYLLIVLKYAFVLIIL